MISQGGSDINPFINTTHKTSFENIWTKDATQNVFGAMAYNTLNLQAGPAHICLGGYDYHNGTRTLGNERDLEAGLLIGRIIATCLLYTSPSPRDQRGSRMPSSA